jgi:hypothetical protein
MSVALCRPEPATSRTRNDALLSIDDCFLLMRLPIAMSKSGSLASAMAFLAENPVRARSVGLQRRQSLTPRLRSTYPRRAHRAGKLRKYNRQPATAACDRGAKIGRRAGDQLRTPFDTPLLPLLRLSPTWRGCTRFAIPKSRKKSAISAMPTLVSIVFWNRCFAPTDPPPEKRHVKNQHVDAPVGASPQGLAGGGG